MHRLREWLHANNFHIEWEVYGERRIFIFTTPWKSMSGSYRTYDT